jgi:hypothetical protein
MSGGTISGNTASSSGGGVYNNGTFTMNAGAIINGNTASGSGGGGGVCNYGTFTMNNGTISGNTASSFPIIKSFGGGVYTNGTFTMGNGTISENTASVYRATGLGGSLYESFGGGVYAGNSTFTMSGGEISGNSTSSYGGGVYVLGSMFTKSSTGGLITGYGNNTVNGNKVVTNGVVQSGQGHAVYVVGNPAKKQENTVPANKALDSRVDGAAGGWTE